MKYSLAQRVWAECIGTAFLVGAVVGSGIMAERLAAGNIALALLANAIATGAALVALILTLAEISGAHMNPVVTLSNAFTGSFPWTEAPYYVLAQIFGGAGGALAAHLMFGLPLASLSHHARGGSAQAFSEFVATFGLLAVIHGCARRDSSIVAVAVGSYITAAYWFTASTSFANPAVTLARSLTDTFSGIDPANVPLFIAAQIAGGAAATLLFRTLSRVDLGSSPAGVQKKTPRRDAGAV
jgi:glycerol uptake facilitator-like aquaporin